MIEGLRAVTFDRVKKAVMEDENMIELRDRIHQTAYDQEFPDKLQDFNKIKHDLHVLDGVPMYGNRLIIPPCLRRVGQKN